MKVEEYKGNFTGDREERLCFQWHGGAFYEFRLPGGRTLITDPYQYGSKRNYVTDSSRQACDVISGCDYVLLTHTHFDHAQDLPGVVEKYPHCFVVVPDDAYVSLMMVHGYNSFVSNIQPVGSCDRLEFEDIAVEGFRGKHTILSPQDPVLQDNPDIFASGIPYEKQGRYQNEDGSFHMLRGLADIEGGMAFRNYKVTLNNGICLFIWGGELKKDFRKYCYKNMKPDILFVQLAATNVGGDRLYPNMDEITEFIEYVNPRIALPIHQENFQWEQLKQMETQCREKLKKDQKNICYWNPEPSRWYALC